VKIIAVDGARNIDCRDIVHVLPHWSEGDTYYATLSLRSGEKITGLVTTAEIDSLSSNSRSEERPGATPLV
jgi:hypothetical protein